MVNNKVAVKIVVDATHGTGKDEALRFLGLLLDEAGFSALETPELFVKPDARCCNVGDPKDEVGFMAAEFLFFVNMLYRALYVKEHEHEHDFILLNRSLRGFKIYLDRCGNSRIIRIMNMCINLFRTQMLSVEDIIFYLHISKEENVRRIRERYKEFPERQDWHEDDEAYMDAIHKGYEDYFSHDSNVIPIDVTDLDKEGTAKAIMSELRQMGLLSGKRY